MEIQALAASSHPGAVRARCLPPARGVSLGGCIEPHANSGATVPTLGTFTTVPQPCPSPVGSSGWGGWGARVGGRGQRT